MGSSQLLQDWAFSTGEILENGTVTLNAKGPPRLCKLLLEGRPVGNSHLIQVWPPAKASSEGNRAGALATGFPQSYPQLLPAGGTVEAPATESAPLSTSLLHCKLFSLSSSIGDRAQVLGMRSASLSVV